MRIILLLFTLITGSVAHAQLACSTQGQNRQGGVITPFISTGTPAADAVVNGGSGAGTASRYMGDGKGVITIPVVFHILYNNAGQNLDESLIRQQLVVLNTAFRKKNADTANIPEAFKSVAADCEIEFKLAVADPLRRSTNGIVRKYTSIKNWLDDDKMKFAASGGSDAWDATRYLNIWVCNLALSSGYSSFPGDAAAKDGIVLRTGLVGSKVLVHETGHWLGLKHLWGDTYCGDDQVDDTPKQSTFTPGCPTGVRPSCGGGAPGDMYMNYMDFTSDACLLMFTQGQKARMWSNFVTSGKRAGIIDSKGLTPAANDEIPLPGEENPQKPEEPVTAALKLYPNPAINRLTVDVGADDRWLGKTISIYNTNGEQVLRSIINGKQQAIDITRLLPGLYFVAGKQENGEQIRVKFIKN
ncbi:M43 family zinc metalloprotease [Terrimonas rubra]|uniref:M43 family zinc metalloprotease n=1 Tax=Terrimonas rubra TaxID=1035890 RepID=A0ABW6A644_9BACT